MRRMRAVEIGEDRSLRPTDIEERPLAPDEARVRVAFCGICGSDLHLRPSPAVPAGAVMGHEFSGTIEELGEAVEGYSVGDRVAIFPFVPCGECSNCIRGDYHVCMRAATGGLGLGANQGGYAESVPVHRSMLIPIPDELSLEHAALVEPLAVALHGIDIGGVERGCRCVVIGAEQILVIERNEQRRERMRSLGVDALGLVDVHDRVIEYFGGELPDVVLECAGNPAAPQLAIELVRSCGIVVLLGVLEEPVEISQLVLLIKEAQLRSSFAYRLDSFREAIELLVAGAVPAGQLITDTVPLERAQEMFERLENPATSDIKILLEPNP
jgi:(R,R)-butanediol dehydrogenase / meso-butanediol dehydrogenase / diacetyl reductase